VIVYAVSDNDTLVVVFMPPAPPPPPPEEPPEPPPETTRTSAERDPLEGSLLIVNDPEPVHFSQVYEPLVPVVGDPVVA
jgi:hypothetical protein